LPILEKGRKVIDEQLYSSEITLWEGEVLCAYCCDWGEGCCYSCSFCGSLFHEGCIVMYFDKESHLAKCPRCRD
jgi:hypothetical protein